MKQLDIFGDEPIKKKLKALRKMPIAGRNDILRVQTEIMLDARSRQADRIRAAELICKMQGYNEPEKHEHNVKTAYRAMTRTEIEAELIAAGFDPAKIALEE